MNELKVKVLSAMEKVFPTKEPSGEGMSGRLSGLRKETVSFQVAYCWEGDSKEWGFVQISAPEGVSVRVRTVGLVPCGYVCHKKRDEDYLSTEPGLYPDVLQEISIQGVPLISDQWRSLWIDLDIQENAPEGCGKVGITLQKDDSIVEKSIDLEVIGAELPELSIPHTEWFHCDCLANYYGVEVFSKRHWEIIENFVKTAVRRGCNMLLTPIFTPPLDTAVGGERTTVQLVEVEVKDGEYKFSYDKFERWVEMCKRCGIRYFEISHLFSQWGAVSCPKIVGTKDGKEEKLFGWHTKADSAEYAEFLAAFLKSFTAEIEELGIGRECYFHISDEPSLDNLESYGKAKELVQGYLKGYHMMDALSNYDFFEKGLVEIPVCATDHIQPFLNQRPESLWTYYCSGQDVDVSNRFIVQPGYRTRILGVQLYKYDIAGFLHWGYNFYNSQYSLKPINPYCCTDADGAFPSGDSFLVYPGANGEPEESIRLLLMDEAMADLRAMKCLELLTDRETVMNLMEGDDRQVTFSSYPRDMMYLSNLREKINHKIKEEVKKLVAR